MNFTRISKLRGARERTDTKLWTALWSIRPKSLLFHHHSLHLPAGLKQVKQFIECYQINLLIYIFPNLTIYQLKPKLTSKKNNQHQFLLKWNRNPEIQINGAQSPAQYHPKCSPAMYMQPLYIRPLCICNLVHSIRSQVQEYRLWQPSTHQIKFFHRILGLIYKVSIHKWCSENIE